MPHADWGAVSITVQQRFDAPDPAGLLTGRSPQLACVVSLLLGAPSARLQNTPKEKYLLSLESDVNMCNAPDTNPTHGVEVSRQLYQNSRDN